MRDAPKSPVVSKSNEDLLTHYILSVTVISSDKESLYTMSYQIHEYTRQINYQGGMGHQSIHKITNN